MSEIKIENTTTNNRLLNNIGGEISIHNNRNNERFKVVRLNG